MNLRKAVGPALTALLLAGIGFAINTSLREKKVSDRASQIVTVKLLSGSEKEKFLTDPEMSRVLAAQGLRIDFQKAGSREIATRPDLKSFDAAYPAGAHAAVKIAQVTGSKRIFNSFYTPLAVASWRALLPALETSGLVAQKDGAYFLIDMGKLVSLMQKGTRWKDLPNNAAYPVGKSVLITSTDVRKSNSGGLYLALASYLANGNNVVESDADAAKVSTGMVSLFSRQGFQESSSAGPFEDYVSMGIGKAPLVMVYEQQFLEFALSHATPNLDMVLLYPAPTILSKHTIVALTDAGARFARVMTTSPQVAAIAQRYGFRSQDNSQLFAAADAHRVAIPRTLVDVIDPPTYDILEQLIQSVEKALNNQ